MTTYQQVKQALDLYDKNKRWHRKAFGDQADINHLRRYFTSLAPVPDKFDRELSTREETELRDIVNKALTKRKITKFSTSSSKTLLKLNVSSPAAESSEKKEKYIPKELANDIHTFITQFLHNYKKERSKTTRPHALKRKDHITRLVHLHKAFEKDKMTVDQFYEYLCILAADYEHYKNPNIYFRSYKSISMPSMPIEAEKLEAIIKLIKEIDLFDDEKNINHIKLSKKLAEIFLSNKEPLVVYDLLRFLGEKKSLTKSLEKKIIQLKDPTTLLNVVKTLDRNKILTASTLKAVMKRSKPMELADAFKQLALRRLFEPIYQSAVARHKNPIELVDAIEILSFSGQLNKNTLRLICHRRHPSILAQAFAKFSVRYPLSLDERVILVLAKKPIPLAEAIILLRSNILYDEAALNILKKSRDPILIAQQMIQKHEEEQQAKKKKTAPATPKHATLFPPPKPSEPVKPSFSPEFLQQIEKIKVEPEEEAKKQLKKLLRENKRIQPENMTAIEQFKEGYPCLLAVYKMVADIEHGEVLNSNVGDILAWAKAADSQELVRLGKPENEAELKKLVLSKFIHLTAEDTKAVAASKQPDQLAKAFMQYDLKDEPIPQEQRAALISHPMPAELAKLFEMVADKQISDECRAALSKYPAPNVLVLFFNQLNKSELTPELIEKIVSKQPLPFFPNLIKAAELLKKEGLSNKENLYAIIDHSRSLELAREFITLNKRKLLSPENHKALCLAERPGVARIEIVDKDDEEKHAKKQAALQKRKSTLFTEKDAKPSAPPEGTATPKKE